MTTQPTTTEAALEREFDHFSIVPFKAICGADRVGQTTTQDPRRAKCAICWQYWKEWDSSHDFASRIPAPSVAPPNHALVQLLDAALLHPESAEGNIRQVIEALSAPPSVAPEVDRLFEAKLLNFAKDWRIRLCEHCLKRATEDNFVISACALPLDAPASTVAPVVGQSELAHDYAVTASTQCSNCGGGIADYWTYCHRCGADREEAAASPVAQLLHCSCGAACTADEYAAHRAMGHDAPVGLRDEADALIDEVQHRMDQVVEAAVEWHQAGREGTEWFEAAEKLGAAIESLLELRAKPDQKSTPTGLGSPR